MKILISPAKSLDFDSNISSLECTQPVFLNKTSQINSVLKEKSPKDLMQLQGISQKLSDLNWKRNNDYVNNHNDKNSRPAVFAFNGDVYNGIDVKTLSEDKVYDLQKSLRILSGYYGVLKPLDLILLSNSLGVVLNPVILYEVDIERFFLFEDISFIAA